MLDNNATEGVLNISRTGITVIQLRYLTMWKRDKRITNKETRVLQINSRLLYYDVQ